ncbi:class I SAM-dependent methyltransferase [Methanoculleus sp. 10]|uniref:class I SAM-dependent DNA methyltransferase n=1 Tax=Methanoculleus sp. 10 TaxID=430615 RepID=UPI0025EAE4D2|nr:class I SAM-dependent methyltransferase [Methanoculleus sp. 10]
MDVFKKYADFYDQLYRDKDYQRECEFIRDIFATYSTRKITSILDLGCGTGSHALIFTDMGYDVTGVDQSETMLDIARMKAVEKNKNIQFRKQDIRHLDLPQQFDAAVAMFAVMGYQTSNRDFEDALISVYKHLSPGGLFIFDVWFGPAVLMQKPQDRVKEVELQDKKIIRYAHPTLDIIKQTVEVNYTVLEIKRNKELAEAKEHHLMRFFFYSELTYFLNMAGFDALRIGQFMHLENAPDESSWNIVVICEKN